MWKEQPQFQVRLPFFLMTETVLHTATEEFPVLTIWTERLKANAVVLYITQNNKNTVSLNVTGATTNPCVGLQTILDGFKKDMIPVL
jgi:hypothetical protein